MNNTSKNKTTQNNVGSSANNARAVIINVDDLGLSDAVNKAVIRLAERGLIGASSYMVGGTISASDIRKLAELNVDIGLHLDLTGIFDSSLRGSLKSIIIASYLRRINPKKLNTIIEQQLDAFEDKFGHPPVFIDGHQHIHQFPAIRQCLITLLVNRYGADSSAAISARVTTPLVNDLKSWIIYSLGGRAWRKLCADNNITTNDKFGGVYGFDADIQQLAVLWSKWLKGAPRTKFLTPGLHKMTATLEDLGTYSQYGSTVPAIHSVPLGMPREVKTSVIMCHPAVPASDWQDEIKAAREREFEWLMSHEFEDLLQQNEVRLVNWSDIADL